MFAELLGRSCFSFLRGASHPEELVERARELGHGAFGLCDLDGLYGVVRGWVRARELGLPFLVGAELTLDSDGEGRAEDSAEPATVALLAQSGEGYRNLCRLLTRSHAGRPKGESACDVAWLPECAAGLLALVPAPPVPPGGEATSPTVERLLGTLREGFGERALLAAHCHLDGNDRARTRWVESAAQRYGFGVVASSRPRFHVPTRKPLADVLHCIRRGLTLDTAGRELGANHEAYLRSEEQMLRLFAERTHWVERTAEVAASVTFDLSQLKYHFPCELPPGKTADDHLAELTWEGVERRYPEGISAELRAQLEKELRLIAKIGVAPYFLSTREVVEIARRRRILCQGRGSAANSAVCYAIGITAVDPARSNLLFERFLSEERAEPPDIDVDFEHERREEVIQEIYERYGRDRAAMVSEVICYRGKSALREVAKAFGLSQEQADRLSNSVTHFDTAEAHEERLVDRGFDLSDARLRQVVALAGQLQGFPRHLSIHVGGFVLSSRPLDEVTPVEPARMEGRTVLPWDKDDIDALGFFKVDVLGLGMLTAVRKALALIHADGGLRLPGSASPGAAPPSEDPGAASPGAAPTPDAPGDEPFDPLEVFARIPAEDPAVYDMICRADTVGVFQIESRAQMAMLPRLRPRRFYDLVIQVAIVRPGPIQGGMVHPYLRRRRGEESHTTPHPLLESILERTLGVPLFQEQVMQIAIVGAGYSGGEADQLRRDMAAWKKNGKLMRHRDRLLEGFAKSGIRRDFGEALFEQIKGFGDYGFPESHASSFALIVYASSWEKAHYPAHFTCAILNSQPMGFYQPSSLVRDAQQHGVEVRDVCVQHSFWDCTLEAPSELDKIQSGAPGAHRALRLGLRLIKGLGEAAGRRIEAARTTPFRSLEDLRIRAALAKDDIEALAEAGALETLCPGRRQALWKARAPRLDGLFAEQESNEPEVTLPALHGAEQLLLDYGRKGLSVSDHPMNYWRRRLRKQGVVRAADLVYLKKGTPVKVAGLVLNRQRPGTASGVVFMTLEDETGQVNLIVYGRIFEEQELVARTSNLLLVHGEVEREAVLPEGATPVIYVVARTLERLGRPGGLRSISRDFH
jgi:error-prone DNA polymerase